MVAVASAALALCFCVTPTSAVGSIVANGSTSGLVLQNGEVVDGSYSRFTDDFSEVENETIVDEITRLNQGETLAEVLFDHDVELPEGSDIDLKDYSLLTRLQDLKAYNAQDDEIVENATVSWEVPNLTREAGDVYVLHYSTVREVWEVIEPDEVNYDTKEITATFKDLSPVAVIYKSAGQAAPETDNETPGTSTSTNLTLYLGIGAIAVLAGGFLVFKSKKN